MANLLVRFWLARLCRRISFVQEAVDEAASSEIGILGFEEDDLLSLLSQSDGAVDNSLFIDGEDEVGTGEQFRTTAVTSPVKSMDPPHFASASSMLAHRWRACTGM